MLLLVLEDEGYASGVARGWRERTWATVFSHSLALGNIFLFCGRKRQQIEGPPRVANALAVPLAFTILITD